MVQIRRLGDLITTATWTNKRKGACIGLKLCVIDDLENIYPL